MKTLIIRIGCMGMLLLWMLGSTSVYGWGKDKPYSQQDNEDDDKDDKDTDQKSGSDAVDGGDESKNTKKSDEQETQIDAGTAPEKGVLPEGGTRITVPLKKTPPTITSPKPNRSSTTTTLPQPAIPKDSKKPKMDTVVPIPAGVLTAAQPLQQGTVLIGSLSPDPSYPQTAFVWELRILWIIAACLALAFIFVFFHLLLPFQSFRFLTKISSFFLILSTAGLGCIIIYQYVFSKILPTSTHQSGLIWFGFIGLAVYLWQKKSYQHVHINAGVLIAVVLGAVIWSLASYIHLPNHPVASHQLSFAWFVSHFFMYTAFGILTVAGSWLVSSGYLGMLARRGRGIGYGIRPEFWEEYRLHSSFLVTIAYPLLTVSWIGILLSSQFYLGNITKIWNQSPRLWSVLFVWLLLTAHLYALRLPKKEDSDNQEVNEWVSHRPSHLPGFLLFLATVGGSILFVGIHFFVTYLRGKM